MEHATSVKWLIALVTEQHITSVPLSERRADSWQWTDDMIWCWDAADISDAAVIALRIVAVHARVTEARSRQLWTQSTNTMYSLHILSRIN